MEAFQKQKTNKKQSAFLPSVAPGVFRPARPEQMPSLRLSATPQNAHSGLATKHFVHLRGVTFVAKTIQRPPFQK